MYKRGTAYETEVEELPRNILAGQF